MRVKNYIDIPEDMNEHWHWVVALDAWDFCEPSLLSELILNNPIPEPLRIHISRIVSGNRKPNRKASVKLKIPAAERMKIAGSLSVIIGLVDLIKHDGKYEDCGVEANAERRGIEPFELLSQLETKRQLAITDAAKELDVSIETIENLLRDLRKKIQSWPDI